MNTWRDTILKEFIPGVSRLTLAADPDSLLTEEKLGRELHRRGFDLIEFNDPVEFRYAYESRYRSVWDRGEYTDLVVTLRLQGVDLDFLPYDLVRAGRKLFFNLGDLFPQLSYPVVEKLDRALLDQLFEAQSKSPPDPMGDNATMDYILRYVFGIAPELIGNDVELLRMLLRLHYGKLPIPAMLLHRLLQVLNSHKRFNAWPLDDIVADDAAFFAFLQERWPIFLKMKFGKTDDPSSIDFGEIRETEIQGQSAMADLSFPGPERLPFDHQDIRVYIDNLFLEGRLVPVEAAESTLDTDSWIKSGVTTAATDDESLRISRLFALVEKELPAKASRYSDWTAFALKWAELSSLVHSGSNTRNQNRLSDMGNAVNTAFAGWLADHYASLINLPPTTPAMVHHVPRRLARDMASDRNLRAALIVVDGLSLDQWVTVRQVIQQQDREIVMRESAVFAWIPTLTSVSRQAIFSGRPPFYFPASIYSTNHEEKLWKKFWEECGLSRMDVSYQRGLGDGNVENLLDAAIHPGTTRVAGLVVDKVDKIMHGMQLGAAGMHNQIRQWCRGGFLSDLVRYLLDKRFAVWLTSDHGNIACEGKGRPAEGVIAETRGERVRVYPAPELRDQVAESFAFAQRWPSNGLPAHYFPLMAEGRDAFVTPGHTIVAHGGAAIEEVIVPLVKIERKTR
jgi:hypothetical protein